MSTSLLSQIDKKSYIATKPKRMTIALGIRVKNGIVLAADRLLSTERHQFEEEKLIMWPLNYGEIFFAYADSPVTAKEVRQKIETRLSREDDRETGISLSEIQEVCETVIQEVYNNRLGSMPLQMLIAARLVGEGTQMWLYDGQAGFNVAGEFEILGAGESSLIRYLKGAYSHQDSIEAGIDLGIYLVHQAGEFIPGCKGIDVYSITSGQWDWLTQEEIATRLAPMKIRQSQNLRKIILG
jgi:20S proteasome alpha/beta subunit